MNISDEHFKTGIESINHNLVCLYVLGIIVIVELGVILVAIIK